MNGFAQMRAVTGDRRLRRNQVSELNSKLALLPGILAEQQQARQNEMIKQQYAKQRKFAKKRIAAEELAQERGMGMEALKLGLNVGSKNLFGGSFKDMFNFGNDTKVKPATTTTMPTESKGVASTIWGKSSPSTFSGKVLAPITNLGFGNIISSGLTGFGASHLFGKKLNKHLVGALAGGLMNMFTGDATGFGGNLGEFASGAIFGGLGSLF